MKHIYNKFLCVVLTFLSIVCMTACNNDVSKGFYGEYKTESGLVYYLYESEENDYAILSGYQGNALSVNVPSKIEKDGKSFCVIEISDMAFYNTTVGIVRVAEGIKRIGNFAFARCKDLAIVELPSTLVSIGDFAFFDNIALQEVKMFGQMPSTGNHVFTFYSDGQYKKNSLLKIRVKGEYFDDYKLARQWAEYRIEHI